MARLIYPERPQRRVDPFAVAEVAAAVVHLNQAIDQVVLARGRLTAVGVVNWLGSAAEKYQENVVERIKTLDKAIRMLSDAQSSLATIHSTVMQVAAEDDMRLRLYYDAMHT